MGKSPVVTPVVSILWSSMTTGWGSYDREPSKSRWWPLRLFKPSEAQSAQSAPGCGQKPCPSHHFMCCINHRQMVYLFMALGCPHFYWMSTFFFQLMWLGFNSPQLSEAFPQMKHEQVGRSAAVHPAISVRSKTEFQRPPTDQAGYLMRTLFQEDRAHHGMFSSRAKNRGGSWKAIFKPIHWHYILPSQKLNWSGFLVVRCRSLRLTTNWPIPETPTFWNRHQRGIRQHRCRTSDRKSGTEFGMVSLIECFVACDYHDYPLV